MAIIILSLLQQGSWGHISPRGCSSWLPGALRDEDVPGRAALVHRGSRESLAGSLSGCTVFPMPFPLSWLKFYVTFSQQTPLTMPKQAEVTSWCFKPWSSPQSPTWSAPSSARHFKHQDVTKGRVGTTFILHCSSSPHVSFHIILLALVTWIF